MTLTRTVRLSADNGLHARPAVRVTQLVRSFCCAVEISLDAAGPWIDAGSIVKLMAARLLPGSLVHLRAKGTDAEAALAALVSLLGEGPSDGEKPSGGEAPSNASGH